MQTQRPWVADPGHTVLEKSQVTSCKQQVKNERLQASGLRLQGMILKQFFIIAFPLGFLPHVSVAGERERLLSVSDADFAARFGLFCLYNTSHFRRGPAALGRGEVRGVPKTPQPGFAGAEALARGWCN